MTRSKKNKRRKKQNDPLKNTIHINDDVDIVLHDTGAIFFFNRGNLNREDGPAVIRSNGRGIKQYFLKRVTRGKYYVNAIDKRIPESEYYKEIAK